MDKSQDSKFIESDFLKQNRKNKQESLPPKQESDTESFGDPQ